MTGTDIREALHAVADTTEPPVQDRTAFESLVRRERIRRWTARAGVGLAAAAAAVAVTVAVAPLGGTGEARDPQPAESGDPTTLRLDAPVYYLADGRLAALDPQGETHDLSVRSEEILGHSADGAWLIGTDSQILRYRARQGGDGSWRFERVESGVAGPVQSAQLSGDGRWLAWIDLDGRLHTLDLDGDEPPRVSALPPNSYLAGLASGTGAALVSEDGDLVLHGPGDPVSVLTVDGGYGWSSTAAGETVAVVDRDGTTRVYDTSTGEAVEVGSAPGVGYLSASGGHLVSVGDDESDASRAWWWRSGEKAFPIEVPGRPQAASWADGDTALVASRVGDATVLVGCELSAGGVTCEQLPTERAQDLTLSH